MHDTVFDDVVSLRGSFSNNALPRSPPELQLVIILYLHVKNLSIQERNMLFVDRASNSNIQLYSLGYLERLF